MPAEPGKPALTIVAVGGFASNSGKTTLVCELLRSFAGWEAIKVTRGHYRSCGKDPAACCVSPMLGVEPLVRSGRAETYARGKDTGRYWDAGASNVHWVIATDAQVAGGIAQALGRVASPGVIIEGNSYLRFIDVDFAVMVARDGDQKIKPSARRALSKTTALYLSGAEHVQREDLEEVIQRYVETSKLRSGTPVYTPATIAQLIERIRAVSAEKNRTQHLATAESLR